MLQTLKIIFTALVLRLLIRHCTRAELQAMNTASQRLSCVTAIMMNGIFTDIEPVIPGSETLQRAANKVISRNEKKRIHRTGSWWNWTAKPIVPTPQSTTRAMKNLAEVVMLVLPRQ